MPPFRFEHVQLPKHISVIINVEEFGQQWLNDLLASNEK
jgi:hypothetical protein